MKLRFAPSPTGYLHVGNARGAVVNGLLALRHGGHFLLRLDDTDRERSRPEFAAGVEEDLRWLGLPWDGLIRQSERGAIYAAAAERLKAKGLLYPCLETEEELRFKREQRLKQGRPPVYDRAALAMTAEQLARAIANGKQPHWRFKLSNRMVEWRDAVLGPRKVKLPSLSDPVLIRADGTPLYTFTSVVDDIECGITHVVRGEDHVTNTGIQIEIFEALGGPGAAPAFAHFPLLTDADGGPLSKRIGSLSLRQLRRDGVEAAALVGYLAALGTAHDPVPGMPAELAPGFEIGAIGSSSARFDVKQLLGLNRRLLHGASYESVAARLPEGADAAFWEAVRGNLDLLGEARAWWEVVRGQIAPPEMPGDAALLAAALAALPPAPWDAATWPEWTAAVRAATGAKGKALYRPLRLALTGEEHGPEMQALLPLIGPELVTARLRAAAGT
jgi:glutamyl-tRNA synthetase